MTERMSREEVQAAVDADIRTEWLADIRRKRRMAFVTDENSDWIADMDWLLEEVDRLADERDALAERVAELEPTP